MAHDFQGFQFQQKLKHLKGKIKYWNRTTFGNIFHGKANFEQDMKQLQQKIITLSRSDDLAEQEKTLERKLMEKEKQEETLWKQKSRIRWLKEGEKNTKFFHNTTIQRRMHNNITHIQNEQGIKVEKHEEIEAELLNYFKQVHKEPISDRSQAIQNITSKIPKLISDEHNQMLLKPVDLQEVEIAVKQLKAGKAPGPNGFTSNFFHNFWDLIKNEVWQVVEESRSLRWMFPGINATLIALIPKVEKPCKPDKFRPISLCNIIYKIISKIIATRLKLLLPLIISPEQSGYVEGRQITDGIILTHEIIHSLKISKKPGMLLKLDLSKVFDSLSWNYIEKILLAFGFNASWVRWSMSLITSSFFSVLINGIPSETFHPSCGIRQGDPLSPFLFIIAAEGLGRSIQHAQQVAQLKGLSFHNSLAFTHQQFVDDTIVYGHPSVQEARHLKSLLADFSEASGASINQSKSQIFFFHTPSIIQSATLRILRFSLAKLPSTYLGAPLIASNLKHSSWKSLLDKLEARLSSWTHRSLNMASRLALIKAILQAMPLYLFSILAAPKWVLKELKAIQRAFLWGSSGLHRKWALVKWETACLPKKGGGIGLRDPTHSNAVMGARIWWRWLSAPLTPWAILWKAKYVGHCPREELIRISKMSQQDYREWHIASQIIPQGTIQEQQTLDTELTKRKIQFSEKKDVLRWGYEERGTYSTREAYNLFIKDQTRPDKLWNKIWDPSIWPKISTFLWLLCHKRVLTWDNLRKRNFIGPSICFICKKEEETIEHLWYHCPLAYKLWQKINFCCQREAGVNGDITATIRNWDPHPYQSKLLNFLWKLIPGFVTWTIWKERNRRIFKDQFKSLDEIWRTIKQNIEETISLKTWYQEYLPTLPQEQSIWNNWKFHRKQDQLIKGTRPPKSSPLVKWSPPPKDMYKLNFDGASKGNLGNSGFRGTIRDYKGNNIITFLGSHGWDTNNFC
eukprot:PITA_07598